MEDWRIKFAAIWNPRDIASWVQAGSIVALAFSIFAAPYLYPITVDGPKVLEVPQDRPLRLYTRDGTGIYFTQTDLLHPERWSWPGSLRWGVVFDVYPGSEPWSRRAEKLSWTTLTAKALAEGFEPADGRLAQAFLAFANAAIETLTRGGFEVYPVPDASTYRRTTGVQALAIIGVTLPRVKISDPSLAGLPTGLDAALPLAAKALDERAVDALSVPLIRTTSRLDGVAAASDTASWTVLLGIVHELAHRHGFERIVLGGFGLRPATLQAKRLAFDKAWQVHRANVVAQARTPTHVIPRLAAVALVVVATRQRFGRARRAIRWWIAIVVATWGLAAAVASGLPALHRIIGLELGPAMMLAAITLMAVVGWFSQQVLTFDVKEELGK